MQKNFHIYNSIEKKFSNSYKYLNAKKTIQKNYFSKKLIPITLFCNKTQKYEPLHNYQDEVSRQEDVPFQKDAFSTNSIQKDFPMQKVSTSTTQFPHPQAIEIQNVPKEVRSTKHFEARSAKPNRSKTEP